MPETSLPEVISAAALRDWALPLPQGHEGSRGRVLVVGGARTAPGAAMLAGLAALRVGAGVLTLAVAESVAAAAGAAVPEAGLLWLPENAAGTIDGSALPVLLPALAKADAVLIGPGLDELDGTVELLAGLVPELGEDVPVVLDAYALGALPQLSDSARSALRDRVILTPNSTEVDVLLERDGDEESDPEEQLPMVAERYRAVVSSGNAVVAPDGRDWQVPAGHAGLGTSGSGDVLAGAVTGLLARGASAAEQAACWATYLHSTAGDRLAAPVGPLGFLAGELLGQLPLILAELRA